MSICFNVLRCAVNQFLILIFIFFFFSIFFINIFSDSVTMSFVLGFHEICKIRQWNFRRIQRNVFWYIISQIILRYILSKYLHWIISHIFLLLLLNEQFFLFSFLHRENIIFGVFAKTFLDWLEITTSEITTTSVKNLLNDYMH